MVSPLSMWPHAGLYCTLEVDSFGYFVNKAKTRVYRDTAEPNWNEVRPCFWAISRRCVRGACPPRASPPASVPAAFPESPGGAGRPGDFISVFLRIRLHTHPAPPVTDTCFAGRASGKSFEGLLTIKAFVAECLSGRFPWCFCSEIGMSLGCRDTLGARKPGLCSWGGGWGMPRWFGEDPGLFSQHHFHDC